MIGFHKGPMGFQIDMENGWTVSVQFGIGNYCSNRSNTGNPFRDIPEFIECPNAEIAAWPTATRNQKDWYIFENGEQVNGWQTPQHVLEFMNKVSKFAVVEKYYIKNDIKGGEYISVCCDSIPVGELDATDDDDYRLGICSQCLNNIVFSKECG